MRQTIADIANWCSRNGPFVITVLSIAVAAHLSFFKDADINTLLPTIIGLYIGTKASTSVSAHWAASKDPATNTAQVIREVEGLCAPKQETAAAVEAATNKGD